MRRETGRIDFAPEVISADDATHILRMQLVPDPRRYDKITRDGKTLYFDRYLHVEFGLDVIEQAAKNTLGIPIFVFDPKIDSAPQYAKERQSALKSEMLNGVYTPPKEHPFQHQSLIEGDVAKKIAFVSVDICGSTALRSADGDAFDRSFEIMLRELGTVVGQFGGSIFKVVGDGFIAFIEHPSFTRQCDNTVDMGLTLIRVLTTAVNPALVGKGLPPLSIRVGAEYGDAFIKQISVPATGFQSTDIASDALNKAVKIQESCSPNEFRIGRQLYELVHVQWLERAEELNEDMGAAVGSNNYKVYRIL